MYWIAKGEFHMQSNVGGNHGKFEHNSAVPESPTIIITVAVPRAGIFSLSLSLSLSHRLPPRAEEDGRRAKMGDEPDRIANRKTLTN